MYKQQTAYTAKLKQTNKQPNKKLVRRPEQTSLQRGHKDG